MTASEKVAKILLKIKAVSLNLQKPFRYSSGILSPVYTDCRILMSYPKERNIVIKFLVEEIRKLKFIPDVIAGTATAGIPYAAWVADALNLPMVYVRGKPKDHGKQSMIEGKFDKNQKTAVIEDLISTGESSAHTVRVLREAGGEVEYILSIMNYGMQKANAVFKENKVKSLSLTNFQTIVEVAKQKKYIAPKEQHIILDWIKDPVGWGKKNGFE